MGFRSPASTHRTEIPAALLLSSVLTAGTLLLPAAPAQASPLAPWAPPPVNSCGETGFDPLARKPQTENPPPPPPDPTIRIPVPVPEFVPIEVPGPKPDNTRVAPVVLPEDPCTNPCPDIRDNPKPKPETVAPQRDPADAASEDTTAPTTTSAPPTSTPGGPSAQPWTLPQIELQTETEPIPIPIPGGEPPEPQPAPPLAVQPPEAAPVAAPVSPPAVESVRLVDQITGRGSTNRTDMRWSVDGTDLGLMWENKPGEVAVVFGDSFGKGWQPNNAGTGDLDWRSNALAYSTDRDLNDGLTLNGFVQDSRCHAAEILDSRKVKNFETTTIPTSGFAIGDRQYLTYMSVNRWSRIPGMWWTNLGGIAWSDDNGSTWTKSQWARWDNLFGAGRFQVATMVPHGDYVYMFGTPNGRMGVIGLARVPSEQVLNKSAYQYWQNGTWIAADGANELLATPLLSGTASELSIRYDSAGGQWQMVYLDSARHQIVLRTAAEPQGAWSDPVPLVDTDDYPKAYGGFIHPWSTDKDLYFTMSAWDSYNVYLMHAALEPR
ncbi:DUF4185 domain-containing protein [Nocardia jejuensis]|uniref:DUF4185 domain-containing protein n=1 Tax=Nocardia jejuensis TaxID=328049 RepID=UPI0009FC8B9A|nr:DUF4185 domain-containing protein [Nocardia jejuensis]